MGRKLFLVVNEAIGRTIICFTPAASASSSPAIQARPLIGRPPLAAATRQDPSILGNQPPIRQRGANQQA
jgi:hypothetical protein